MSDAPIAIQSDELNVIVASPRALPMLLVAGVLLTLLGCGRAQAQWHLDLQTGPFVPTSDLKIHRDFGDIDIDTSAGGAFVVGGGYLLNEWLDLTAQSQAATNFDANNDNVNVYSLTAGLRIFPLSTRYLFRPWLGTQIGWYRVYGIVDDFFDDEFDFDHHHHNDFDEHEDSFGLNAGGGFDIPVAPQVSLGLDVRYHNAFDAFHGFEFVTTLFNVSIWFGGQPAPPPAPLPAPPPAVDSDTPPVPRNR